MVHSHIKNLIKQQFITNYSNLFKEGATRDKQTIQSCLTQILDKMLSNGDVGLNAKDKFSLIEELTNDFLGFGPLTPLMDDLEVTEIMVNGPNKIFAERKGKMELTGIKFDDESQLMQLII